MKASIQTVYQEYTKVLAHATSLQYPVLDQISQSFQINLHYWYRLQECVKREGFRNLAEEILFFKHIKPTIFAQIDLSVLLYQGLLFEPVDHEHKLRYWELEAARLEQFQLQHKELLNYYEAGRTERDAEWFTHDKSPGRSSPWQCVQNIACSVISKKDNLLARWWALKDYAQVVAHQQGLMQAAMNNLY
jgi:hypothetical protein